ncbi:MAG: hypothetical protein HWE22_02080 [Flavobacteriales bacterium]|nr:hypothetical protein [Flavobacteriales bacterium]
MERRSKFIFQVIIGVIIIGAVIFLAFRFLMRGSPFFKVMALGAIVLTIYLVVDFLKRKAKYK